MKNKTLNIKATHIDLSDEIKSYIESKINSLDKFIDATEKDLAIFDVEVGRTTTAQHTGNIFRSEINIEVHGIKYRSESVKDNLHSALDESTHEVERQLRRQKNKRKTLFKRGAEKIKSMIRGNK